MKKYLYLFSLLFSFLLISCEEEIVLDFDETIPRLVIEGNIFMGEPAFNKITLSTTTDFYSSIKPSVNNAQVSITDLSNNTVYEFVNNNNGDFLNTTFLPEIGGTYELTVIYNNETYKATSTVIDSPEVLNVDQKNDGGFTGDSYEITFNFQDNPNEENYYLVQIISPADEGFGVINDQFSNGNIMGDLYFYEKEDIKPGDDLTHYIAAINKQYYNYLAKLFSISGETGNPFASPVGTIKGNIINQTDEANFALGYFHIAKRNQYNYIVK
ncbi:DUF4249 domain-containing protein [Paenimyroides aestuarii]|uniref:DUF4249 domain-containing protein n=1 Tax=Paenimyroides aestuarii TaxID=2968490 RepID=A0ABY5NS32_9FLAO|nr:DUF4249 domain-containing protein [Paenimyroides aestuarii]UUV21371.1 DUF4249 domain-containing protein [Paenimyroides aestuarii]